MGKTSLFRGLKLMRREIDSFTIGDKVCLTGYQSTSKSKSIAMKFAFRQLASEQVPVIFEIEFKGENGLFEMSRGFSVFPGEDEILIQDGLEYRVLDNMQKKAIHTSRKISNQKYQFIKLGYPAGKSDLDTLTTQGSDHPGSRGINDTL